MVIRKAILIFYLSYCFNAISQQKPLKTYNLNSEFRYQVEISSMDIIDGKMFILSESCGYLYQFNINKLNDSRENLPDMKVRLPFLNGLDVEGLALFDHYIFYVNEDGNSIKSFNLETLLPIDVEPKIDKLPKNNDDHNQKLHTGLEGIDINNSLSILYVIHERDKKQTNSKSRLIAYRVGKKNNKFILSYIDELEISLKDDFRYSSITLSEDNSSIFLIRSKFIESIDQGEYVIDKIDLEKTGMFLQSKTDMKTIEHFKIDNNEIHCTSLMII